MDIEFCDYIKPDAPTVEEEYRRLALSEVPFEAAYGKMMLDLLDALRRDVIGPRLAAMKSILWHQYPELLLLYKYGYGHNMAVCARVDYKERSPLVDGLPLLHYRLRRDLAWPEPSVDPQDELRTRNVDTACEFILEAIRKCRESL